MKILPVFIPARGCPYKCVYCDQQVITNTSNIDLRTIEKRIKDFCKSNTDGIYKEIAFYGGTFTNLQKEFIEKLLSITDPFINKFTGLRISTRPDHIDLDQLQYLRQKGLRTVELGIQSFSDKVLQLSGRLYTKKIALQACQTVKSSGLNLGLQLMPGLPGFSRITLNQTLNTVIMVKPAMVRIYPTIVLKGTVLENSYLKGVYKPLTLAEAVALTSDMITVFEQNNINVIKAGLHSDISKENIVAGPYHESFGELIRIELMLKKIIANYQEKQTFVISKYDISLFKGFKQNLIYRIKQYLKLDKIPVIIDQNLDKGEINFVNKTTEISW